MRRGWCPSLHEPMATGDGLLVRVKPPGGVLTASASRLVADAAARHGNGILELTARANLQVRGLSPGSVGPFAQAMVAAGLASADPGAERRRSVIASPLADAATAAITSDLEAALEADAALAALPAKFGFLVDGGGPLPFPVIARSAATRQSRADSAALAAPGSPRRDAARDDGPSADIRVLVFAEHVELACDGGEEVSRIALDEAVPAALLLARTVLSFDGWRMRQAVEAHGLAPIFAAAGLSLEPASTLRAAVSPIGTIAYGAVAFGAGLPFGSTTARIWSALADLAERHGDGKLRLTPWRAVLIAGVAPSRTQALRAALADLGLITDPDDDRRRVFACPGQPACASASVPTRTLAARLKPPPGGSIHVAGCDKGCAHPGPASITWVGRDGRFDLVQDGRAGDPPSKRGLSPVEMLAP